MTFPSITLKRTGLLPGETIHSQRRNGMPRWSGRACSGFTLVVTLSLMILLTVIAVGLLTLSSISLRSSAQTQALASARADILDKNNPPVLGVWTNWQGDAMYTRPSTGNPIPTGSLLYPTAALLIFRSTNEPLPNEMTPPTIMTQMTSRERVLSAFNRTGYDRIPVKHEATPEVNRMLMNHFGLTHMEQLLRVVGDDSRHHR